MYSVFLPPKRGTGCQLCLSARLSHEYCIETAKDIVELVYHLGSTIIVVF